MLNFNVYDIKKFLIWKHCSILKLLLLIFPKHVVIPTIPKGKTWQHEIPFRSTNDYYCVMVHAVWNISMWLFLTIIESLGRIDCVIAHCHMKSTSQYNGTVRTCLLRTISFVGSTVYAQGLKLCVRIANLAVMQSAMAPFYYRHWTHVWLHRTYLFVMLKTTYYS